MNFGKELNGILTIAARDFIKLLRDRARMISSLIFPVIFIGALGKGLQASLGNQINFDFLTFTFTGVFAQVLFQSTASGVSFLIQDRENDFSQEIFVSPISRYSIIFGKILGETFVSFAQAAAVLIFGFILGVHYNFYQLITLLVSGLLASFLGGAYGTLILANLGNLRSAQQIFPFFIFPLIFVSGVFTPIIKSPQDLTDWILFVLSRLSPLTYAVDFTRNLFYLNTPDYPQVVLFPAAIDLVVILIVFTILLVSGTVLFVKSERNR